MAERLAEPPPSSATAFVDLRGALGRFATGVAFVTAAPGGAPLGLIVNSLVSVSLSPPLVSFCPSRDSFTWSRMQRTGRFGVNVLGAQHARFVERATPPGADRFAGVDWLATPGGVPRLADALAFVECTLADVHRAGDHWIVLGRVEATCINDGGVPLLSWAGRLHPAEPVRTADD
ncbi:MAG: flavin reductase family protein [Solirubrobacteraceae bacterium]